MDTLIAILSIVTLLGLFGVIAAIVGEDTRDGVRRRPVSPAALPLADMSDWASFAAADPGLAEAGRRLLERPGHGSGLLASVRDDIPPRINPVSVAIVGRRLLVFVIIGSAKDRDLLEDGRYALHAHQDPAVPARVRGPRSGRRDRRSNGPGRGDRRVVLRGRRRLPPVRARHRARAPRRARERRRLASGLPELACGRRLRSPGPLRARLEHHDLARRLAGPEPVEGILEVREGQAAIDEPVHGQAAREVGLRVAREVDRGDRRPVVATR